MLFRYAVNKNTYLGGQMKNRSLWKRGSKSGTKFFLTEHGVKRSGSHEDERSLTAMTSERLGLEALEDEVKNEGLMDD